MKIQTKVQRKKVRVLLSLVFNDNIVAGQDRLDLWARNPEGFAIIRETSHASVTGIRTEGCDYITIERTPLGGKALMRRLEAIREMWDENPLVFDPVIVIVPADVEKCPVWEQFARRAAVILEV